ncbi:MAG: 16S rRNA (adenine(1518)-N(6)/adenine(1519)-N(6))-dimethyltransferase RsmA [Bryobacteraceae bacterium]|nr:16S rRNA (adenine(1518)-N(6)/adenine(1519)-N(6))-dimethyltransferase RsmA [Bryobacteraceae bacterium]
MGRRLGQHFLRNETALRRIAEAACPDREPPVIEIGPGRGALTAHLIERCDKLIAIELDSALAAGLRERFPKIEVVEANVLDVDPGPWDRAAVVGNLPYYITSPIVEKTLASGFSRAVFLVQEEVADRLAAAPGNRDYGYLSVVTQSQATVEKLFRVPASAFSPPPKVESAVVRLTPFAKRDPEFLRFASSAFRQKRKTLRNNLLAAYPAIGAMPEAGLRAEQLGVPQLKDLYARLIS